MIKMDYLIEEMKKVAQHSPNEQKIKDIKCPHCLRTIEKDKLIIIKIVNKTTTFQCPYCKENFLWINKSKPKEEIYGYVAT